MHQTQIAPVLFKNQFPLFEKRDLLLRIESRDVAQLTRDG